MRHFIRLYSPSPRRGGFTLIELSIVLVIIGLIVGGVLVGRDLISAAAVRAQITQFENYATALATFQGKYNCLPGDCANASSFNLGANGNGNGILATSGGYPSPDSTYDGELPVFFIHLSAAGLIKGTYDGSLTLGRGYPRLAINEQFGMIAASQWGSGINGTEPNNLLDNYGFPAGIWLFAQMCYNLQSATDLQSSNDYCGVMTASQAYSIDKKVDDGKPVTGKVWGYASYYFQGCGTDQAYTIPSNINYCQMAYRLY